MSAPLDVAYYYPAPYWNVSQGGWVKSLLLFFDRISILLPSYMYGRHHLADPAVAEPLEDLGLLNVLDPNTWIDQEMAKRIAMVVSGLLDNGAFDELPKEERFRELSQSRIGYGADLDLAQSLVAELEAKGLARPSEDGVSIPLHPTVRTTILVILAQLARSSGVKQNLAIHPATQNLAAIKDLIHTLSRDRMPSRESVIALDLEPVTFNLDQVPIDELLEFRSENRSAHREYVRALRGFMAELADIDDAREREDLLLQRRQEIADTAHELQRSTRKALKINLASWSLGIAGSAWSVTSGDPLGVVLGASGLAAGFAGSMVGGSTKVTAYSYLFQVGLTFTP